MRQSRVLYLAEFRGELVEETALLRVLERPEHRTQRVHILVHGALGRLGFVGEGHRRRVGVGQHRAIGGIRGPGEFDTQIRGQPVRLRHLPQRGVHVAAPRGKAHGKEDDSQSPAARRPRHTRKVARNRSAADGLNALLTPS